MRCFGHQRIRVWQLALPALVVITGCTGSTTFRDQAIVWQADDRMDISEPEEREYLRLAYFADLFAMRRLTRTMELHDSDPALNTNALDEVPDSTWFTNRIGARPVSPDEAALGPAQVGPPQLPLTVTRGKGAAGGNPGFFVVDATDRLFLIKFDPHENPEMQTATSVIVNRIFWTLGYNVPADTVFVFRREDLHLSPDATVETVLLDRVPMTEEDIDRILSSSPRNHDGSYRASASQFLDGIPIGGFSNEGTRDDDINDTVPHEDRRELRGLRVFAAWVSHTDMKEDNTLDLYVEEGGTRFLRHYLLDFGEALGAHQAEKGRMEDGWEHAWDWQNATLGLVTFGLWVRPWEHQENTIWPSIGAFSDEWFEPELWRVAYPYWAFFEADAADLYWGAKLVMRFDRELLEAIVASGQLSQPEAGEYLVDALLGRQERIGQAWLEAVTPLDYFFFGEEGLCALDLGVHYGLAVDGAVQRLASDFWADGEDEDGVIEEFRVSSDGLVCLPIADSEDYVIERLRLRRQGESESRPVMQVHYIGGSEPRVLGIIRVESH